MTRHTSPGRPRCHAGHGGERRAHRSGRLPAIPHPGRRTPL